MRIEEQGRASSPVWDRDVSSPLLIPLRQTDAHKSTRRGRGEGRWVRCAAHLPVKPLFISMPYIQTSMSKCLHRGYCL